ncbi:MAG: hypothetical protein NTX90_08655, partial [Alphaproteobacteria bacterium]|nr:hypothetical protein [Alphaproteobacteria bacterium]
KPKTEAAFLPNLNKKRAFSTVYLTVFSFPSEKLTSSRKPGAAKGKSHESEFREYQSWGDDRPSVLEQDQ